MGAAAIDVRSVSRAYPGVQALEDVSFSVQQGEMVGLVGHNGAGKSTLTRILGGVEKPDVGTISVHGRDVSFGRPDDAISAGVCVVPQHLSVVPLLTVEENILLGVKGSARGAAGRRLKARVRAVAARLDLVEHLERKVQDSRPSTQRLVMIARALLREPRVMLLDEPTAALHPSEVARVFEVVQDLRGAGMAIVFISHRLDEVLEQTSRVTVMRQGRVVTEAPSATLDKRRLGELIAGRAVAAMAPAAPAAHDAGVLLRCAQLAGAERVADVSLVARRGEVVGLAGLSGSGRSDVLRMIAGIQPVDAGEITVNARSVGATRRSSIRAGVAFLPDDRVTNGVVPEMTVAETVTLSDDRASRVRPRIPLLRRAREQRMVNEVLNGLDMHPRGAAARKMKHLSGGNQQKALMARAMLSGATVFLFDEPTEGVDVGAREDLHREIRRLAERGAAVVVASSESDELVRLADRVVVLYDGRVCAELAGAELTEAAVTSACLLG